MQSVSHILAKCQTEPAYVPPMTLAELGRLAYIEKLSPQPHWPRRCDVVGWRQTGQRRRQKQAPIWWRRGLRYNVYHNLFHAAGIRRQARVSPVKPWNCTPLPNRYSAPWSWTLCRGAERSGNDRSQDLSAIRNGTIPLVAEEWAPFRYAQGNERIGEYEYFTRMMR